MAAADPDQLSAVTLDQLDDVTYFHAIMLPRGFRAGQAESVHEGGKRKKAPEGAYTLA